MLDLAKKIRDAVKARLMNAELNFSEKVVESSVIAALANVFDLELNGTFQQVGFRPNTSTSGVFSFIEMHSPETVAAAKEFVNDCIDESCRRSAHVAASKDSAQGIKNKLFYMNKDLADSQERIMCQVLYKKAQQLAKRDAAQIYELVKADLIKQR